MPLDGGCDKVQEFENSINNKMGDDGVDVTKERIGRWAIACASMRAFAIAGSRACGHAVHTLQDS